ncbi:hypothetical protein ACOSP7_015004 [Xanthoceras sorbifolium]
MNKREVLAIEEGSKTCFTNTTKKKSELKQDPHYLSKDIVRLIMEKLPWKERVQLSLVCKSWKNLFDEIQDTEEFLPWVMCFDSGDGGATCKLSDPSTHTCYTLKKPTYGTERELLFGANICASRCGWVLLSNLIFVPSHLPCYYNKIYFLYSPFTNKIIEFPLLESDETRKATFSSNPDSPDDCSIIALSIQGGNLFIKTCNLGSKLWKTFEFNNVTNKYSIYDDVDDVDVVYAGGFFYYFFNDGKMVAFNIKQQEWKLLTVELPVTVSPYSHTIGLFVSFNGDVILRSQNLHYRWGFWRFDLLEKKWVDVGDEIIEKQVIFLGSIGFDTCPSSFSVPALGNAREFAGNTDFSCCYSIFNIMRHSKYYKWLEDDKRRKKIWIRPPFPNPLRASHLLQSSSKPYPIDR